MEREDFIIRSTSPIYAAALKAEQGEQTVQDQTTESLVRRSRSHEDLQAMLQEPQSVQARDTFTTEEFKKCKQTMKESFEFTFHDSREMMKEAVTSKYAEDLRSSVRGNHAIFQRLSAAQLSGLFSMLVEYAMPEPFKDMGELKGLYSQAQLEKISEFYNQETLLSLYEAYLKGEDLYERIRERLIVQMGSLIYIRRISPLFFPFHFANIPAEIFDFTFELYRSEPLLYRIKNAMILYYICMEVYEKLISDIFKFFQSFLFSQQLRVGVSYQKISLFLKVPKTRNVIYNFLTDRAKKSRDPEGELKKFVDEFSCYLADYKKYVRETKSHALNLDYIALYLSKHETAREALENRNVFPDKILAEFIRSQSVTPDQIRQFVMNDEVDMLKGSFNRVGEIYYSRSNFFLSWDQCHFSSTIRFLEDKFKAVKIRSLKDKFSLGIHQLISPLLLKLKKMDLASPAYKIDDIQAIYQDLKTLRILIENLQGISALAKAGDIPVLKSVTEQKSKKKKVIQKKETAPVLTVHRVQSEQAPLVETQSAVKSQFREKLTMISEISQRIARNIELENQFYVSAKNYILGLMSNTAAMKLVEELFDSKSNLKNIMSESDMKLIMGQLLRGLLPKGIQVLIENLKGSNGFRFRVGDQVYTSHASSAEIGHKGHGGAVKGFRDFLISVYGLSVNH